MTGDIIVYYSGNIAKRELYGKVEVEGHVGQGRMMPLDPTWSDFGDHVELAISDSKLLSAVQHEIKKIRYRHPVQVT